MITVTHPHIRTFWGGPCNHLITFSTRARNKVIISAVWKVVILLNFQTNLESLSSRRVGVYFYCFKITDKSYVHSEVTPLISNYNTITIQRFEKSGTRTSTSSKQRPHFGANIPTTSHHITLQRSSKCCANQQQQKVVLLSFFFNEVKSSELVF